MSTNCQLIIQNKKVSVQELDENVSTIIEYKIHNFINFTKYNKEVSIKIDDFILECLKTSRFIKFDNKIINFDNSIEYEYETGDILEVHTQSGSEVCGVVLPSKIFMDDDYSIKIYIEDKKLIINDECGTKFSLETIHCSKMKETQCQCFNSKFIINVFKKNLDTFCIVHMKKDFPICFEFSDKKIFIAPLGEV